MKKFVTILLLLFCLNMSGQKKEIVPSQNGLVQKDQPVITSQQETILLLKDENEAMEKRLQELEQEIELYRGDVRTAVSEVHDDMSHWLTMLSIIIGLLGVIIPLIINYSYGKYVERMWNEAKEESHSAKEEVLTVKNDFDKILPEMKNVEQQVAIAKEQMDLRLNIIEKQMNEGSSMVQESSQESKEKGDAYYYLNRGILKNRKGDQEGARNDFNKAIELAPKAADAYYNRGILKTEINNLEGAIDDYNKAIELDPYHYKAYQNRAYVKSLMKDWAGAIMDYDKSIEINPKNEDAYFNRANVKNDRKDKLGAIEDYDKVIELVPTDKAAYYNRANVKADLGDYLGALVDYDKAIEIDPQYAKAYNNRASVKKDMCNWDGALADYSKAIELIPNFSYYYRNRAKCYRKMAELEQNSEKRTDLIAKAEGDEKRVAQLLKA